MPITTKPFASQAQQRFAFGTGQPWAKRWADETDFSKLPKRVRRIRSKSGLKGCTCGETTKEQIAPGITRIHGNLCNVHGRYGPCDAAASGKKPKGGKGRTAKPKKPVKTPEQRQQEREAQHAQNRADVLQQLNIAPDGQQALEALRNGEQPDAAAVERAGLVEAGLAERGRDGTLRLTGSGRAMLGAADQGDFGRAGATIGAARDRVGARQDRQSATQQRRAAAQAKREQAAAARAERLAKRGSGGGGKSGGSASTGRTTDPEDAQQRRVRFEQGQADRQERLRRQTERDQEHAQDRAERIQRRRESDARRKRGEARAAARAENAAQGLRRHKAEEYGGIKRTNLDDSVFAGPDRSFPIKTAQDVRNAVMSLGRTKHDKDAVKRGIIRRARAIGATDALPESWRTKGDYPDQSQFAGYTMEDWDHDRPHRKPSREDVERARQQFARALGVPTVAQHKESFQVYKDSSGADRWVSISSTAYRDRDREIVSTKALQGAVALADASGWRGPLRFWHVPGVEIGDCDFQATAQDGRFLIESGTFRSPALAAAVKSRAGGYQVSIGFTHPANEPDPSGVFSHIAIFERSLVPKGRASNPFTQVATKELRMLTEEKATQLKELLGGDQSLLDSLLGQVATTDKAAQAGGVAYKDDTPAWAQAIVTRLDAIEARFKDDTTTEKAAPPPIAEEEPPVEAKADGMGDMEVMAEGEPEGDENMLTDGEISAIATAVVSALTPLLDIESKMAGHLNEMKGLIGGMGTQKDAALAEVKEQLKAVTDQVADLSGSQPRILAGGYRASQASTTVTTEEKVKEAQPAADPKAAAFGAFMTDLGFGTPQPQA